MESLSEIIKTTIELTGVFGAVAILLSLAMVFIAMHLPQSISETTKLVKVLKKNDPDADS